MEANYMDGSRCLIKETCYNEADGSEIDEFFCSECGIHLRNWERLEMSAYEWEEHVDYVMTYCPNCGRKIMYDSEQWGIEDDSEGN